MTELEILNAALAVGWVKFSYVKLDGTKRVAIGTRNRALVEQVLGRRIVENPSFYSDCNGYFDLSRNDWRQFKTNNFIGIELDRLTNEQAAALTISITFVNNESTKDTFDAVSNLVGAAVAFPLMGEIEMYSHAHNVDTSDDDTDLLIEHIMQSVSGRFPFCGGISAKRTESKPKRSELIDELNRLRKREDEILKLLLA